MESFIYFNDIFPFLDDRIETHAQYHWLHIINIGCIFDYNTRNWIPTANQSSCLALALSNVLCCLFDRWRYFVGDCSTLRKCNQGEERTVRFNR